MECKSCGTALASQDVYCSRCGEQAPEPESEPYARTADLFALSERLSALETSVLLHQEESERAWSRIPMLEDSERRHRRILNSSHLYTDMFGIRLVTMVGYGLLSGVVASAIIVALALATGVLHF